MTDQASFNDGGSRVDHQCELPTILSLQALDGLSAPESRIQAVPETAEAGAPMNRDLRNRESRGQTLFLVFHPRRETKNKV